MKTTKYVGLTVLAAMLTMTSLGDTYTNYYGDFAAADVDFLDVRESSVNIGSAFPMYGAPTVTTNGNTMDFNPTGFEASAGGGGVDFTDGNLGFSVKAHQDAIIEQIGFSESGIFTLLGNGTADTFVNVTATFYLEVNEIDYQAVDTFGAYYSLTFNPGSVAGNGHYDLANYGQTGAQADEWSGNVLVDVDGLIADNGKIGRATKVSVNLDNVLSAITEEGTIASISKKEFEGSVSIEIIPEPASLLLIGMASSVIVFGRRRFIA